jgi:hypothetical protein
MKYPIVKWEVVESFLEEEGEYVSPPQLHAFNEEQLQQLL